MLLLFKFHGSSSTTTSTPTIYNGPDVDQYLRVDLTLKQLETGTTQTITLLDRNPEMGYTSEPSYTEGYTILTGITGIGMEVGQSGLPLGVTGSIALSDALGSIGEDRRLFDLFERYTIVQQTCTVYYLIKRIEEALNPSDWVQLFSGVVNSYSKDFEGEEVLSLSVSSIPIPDVVITKEIDENILYGSERGSSGRFLPLVIGALTDGNGDAPFYPAIQTRESTDALSAVYYYSATRGTAANGFTSTDSPSLTSCVMKDTNGDYRNFQSDTALISLNTTGSTYPTPFGATETAIGTAVYTFNTGNFVYTWGRCWFKGQNNVALTPAGDIIFRLYQMSDDATGKRPANLLATATVAKSDWHTELQGASDFWVDFAFDKAVMDFQQGEPSDPEPAPYIVLSVQLSQYATSTTDFVPGGVSALDTSVPLWTRTNNGDWSAVSLSGAWPALKLGGVGITAITSPSGTVDANGVRALGFTLDVSDPTQFAACSPALTKPSLSFDILINQTDARGRDNAAGTLTGGSNQSIEDARDVFNFLMAEWSGSSWGLSSKVNTTYLDYQDDYAFADGSMIKLLGGFSDRLTLGDALTQLCAHTGGKIIQLQDGKLAFWVPAPNREYYFEGTLWDEDFTIKGWRTLDLTSVVNRADIYYQTELRYTNEAAGKASGEFSGFRSSLQWRYDTNAEAARLSTQSYTLYGERPLSNTKFPLIKNSTSAAHLARFNLRTFDTPHNIVTIDTDFYESNTIELLDRLDLLSVRLPGYLGSSPSATLPSYSGSSVQFANGNYWKRAKRYKTEVIARRTSWTRGSEIDLNLDCRVISPGHPNEPV